MMWSYCLMDTHWHMLLRTPQLTLSAGMRRLNSCYARLFNIDHGRTGHSIRHRFMSVPVEDTDHLRELSRYLPLNPVRGGLVRRPDREANSFSIRRFADACEALLYSNQLPGFAPVRIGYEQVRAAGKEQVAPIGRPRRIMAQQAAEPVRGSRWQRETPELRLSLGT